MYSTGTEIFPGKGAGYFRPQLQMKDPLDAASKNVGTTMRVSASTVYPAVAFLVLFAAAYLALFFANPRVVQKKDVDGQRSGTACHRLVALWSAGVALSATVLWLCVKLNRGQKK
uniref:Membrane protein n=1 Tax=Marseillevirus LCMAC103 TaxID=2506604 RepID=A0A481YVX4_9VIRU|nr:MAG: membrane protein [Marseillevirus LCMAC103]